MIGNSEAIERALSELATLVAAQLSDEGWVRRDLGEPQVLILTKTVRDGVFASVEVEVTSARWPRTWPEEIDVEFGAGYEPALGLMPLVTLRPWVALASESHPSGRRRLCLEIPGAGQVPEIAARPASTIRERGTGFAERYDVDAFESALTDTRQWPYERAAELRPVLLASAGRGEQARSALEDYLASGNEEIGESDYQRFARQLTRWLDAGDPPPPPIEATLRRLPPPPEPQRPSWSRTRQESRDQEAARDAVRAVARGKTREQIGELLTTEYAARGLDVAPSVIAYAAEAMELEQQPLGRLRGLVHVLRTLTTVATDGVEMVRGRTLPNPDWMQPPPRAAYVVDTTGPATAVAVDPDAEPVLARAAAEATRRLGPVVLLDVWLDADSDQHLRVHLGEHEIGSLHDGAARLFATDLRAATELFDESIRVRATLTPASSERAALLEIGRPKHAT